jgi:hypothetical protein
MKFSKNETQPIRSEMESSSGRAASRPVCATLPGRRSAVVNPARRLEAEAGEALEDDAGEVVPVADDVGEDADEQRLLDQPRDDVLVGAPRPEQRRQRHVDDDQRGRDERHLAASRPKPCRCSG